MKRALLCCAVLGALALVLIACKSAADNSQASATEKNKPAQSQAPTAATTAPSTEAAPVKGSYETIPQERAKSEMDALAAEGKPFILLDVRRQDEFDNAYIEGAILLPNEEIGAVRPQELPDLSVPIYVYCRSGRRSLEAAKKLAAMGYTVYDFGGIISWQYGTVS